jgi:hypothetical protein
MDAGVVLFHEILVLVYDQMMALRYLVPNEVRRKFWLANFVSGFYLDYFSYILNNNPCIIPEELFAAECRPFTRELVLNS